MENDAILMEEARSESDVPDDLYTQTTNQIDSEKKREKNKDKIKKKKKSGEGADAHKVIRRLQNFDANASIACKKLNSKFGKGIVHEELKGIAEFICDKIHITIDRDAKRDNRVLYKWFDENWESIEPIIDKIEIYDKNNNQIH